MSSSNSRQRLPSRQETMILATLESQERYGLAISGASGGFISLGALYTTLHRMEDKGLVTSQWGEPTEARQGARRRYYYITPVGRSALAEVRNLASRVLGLGRCATCPIPDGSQ